MRLDKFLKVSRIIKRRTVAQEACDGDRVLLNGKEAKPAAQVKPGDILKVTFGNRTVTYEVVTVLENARKEQAAEMVRVLPDD